MKTADFCEKYEPCRNGKAFALQYETMSEVWEKCTRPDWLFYILEKHAPLEKEQSVRLAIAFAETCLGKVKEGEDRPRLAIEAAKAWLENPTEENRAAAYAAAYAAYAAAYAAAAAAAYASDAAAYASDAAAASADAAAAAYAAYAADAAADAAYADADAAQCGMIRSAIKNPFTYSTLKP